MTRKPCIERVTDIHHTTIIDWVGEAGAQLSEATDIAFMPT